MALRTDIVSEVARFIILQNSEALFRMHASFGSLNLCEVSCKPTASEQMMCGAESERVFEDFV